LPIYFAERPGEVLHIPRDLIESPEFIDVCHLRQPGIEIFAAAVAEELAPKIADAYAAKFPESPRADGP
jgi:hypothetical protein